jgi:hypothetical protein
MEKAGGADDLYTQQTTVGVEIENDAAPARTVYDDVLHDRPVRYVSPDHQVVRVRVARSDWAGFVA